MLSWEIGHNMISSLSKQILWGFFLFFFFNEKGNFPPKQITLKKLKVSFQ